MGALGGLKKESILVRELLEDIPALLHSVPHISGFDAHDLSDLLVAQLLEVLELDGLSTLWWQMIH